MAKHVAQGLKMAMQFLKEALLAQSAGVPNKEVPGTHLLTPSGLPFAWKDALGEPADEVRKYCA
ncbi:hypothetical protein GCM10010885_06850 [Alicyclobacillus cellulosilyticus]|uniref:Uncharacterized protein n=1 Tax=Alicyclobacillus cellulosilyticus TaxID=1003997 RepID=A0A917K4Z6_9BACL|nr:hypothetical protein [Alicyclobacillus cellulosilyticus]GGJ00260.1 hypothetical protein GCM10010885_06850 [Alicyclobacillus cellulosilyticus]